jgi:tetratricopeptide (TPR) repeat protein
MNSDLQRAFSFHKNGQLDKAENLYLEILKTNINNSTILQLLGTLYLQKKNFELSKKYLIKSLKIDPINPSTLNNLGHLEKNNKNYSKAMEYFQINIDKNNFLGSWINKLNILVEEEKFDEGLKFSKLAIKKYPNDLKIRNNYAIFLYNCGFKKECFVIYKEFDDKKLHFRESYINYSKILFQNKSYKEALTIINNILLVDNKNLPGLIQRYLIYKSLNQFL